MSYNIHNVYPFNRNKYLLISIISIRNVMPDNYTEFVKDRRENKTVAVDNMFAVGAVMVMVAVVAAIL